MWLHHISREVVEIVHSPSSPYLFIFIGFNLATIALVITLNLTIPKNLLERLYKYLKEKGILGTNQAENICQNTRILHYFFWIDFITFCWLISLVASILNAATILLVEGQLNIIKKIWIIQLFLIMWAVIHCIVLIYVVLKVRKERRLLFSRCVSLTIWMIIGMVTIILLYFSLARLLNCIILLYVFLFCIYLGSCLFQQYRLMPVTALIELWRLTPPIEKKDNK
jgi:hypothetical protein